jgi:hypothetical protein
MHKKRMVVVVAREGVDLVKLSGSEGPMSVPCGTIGPSIAKRVLQEGGTALIPAGDIRLAIDTCAGVNALLDSFHLLDDRTRRPLLLQLLLKNP